MTKNVEVEFSKLHKTVPSIASESKIDFGADNKLQKIQTILEVKKQEVKHFSNVPDITALK